MRNPKTHISICICTYKRPEKLLRLLEGIKNQSTEELFTYSIIVVDNDHTETARVIIEEFKSENLMEIDYYVEPDQNIALARNRAVKHAAGEFLAFIDDDEFPVNNNWLLMLYKTCAHYGADGILGPVRPLYEKTPPEWIVRGGFFERPSHTTGTVLDWNNTRTGNALVKSVIVDGIANRSLLSSLRTMTTCLP